MACPDSQHPLRVTLDRLGSAPSPYSMEKLMKVVFTCVCPGQREQEPELGIAGWWAAVVVEANLPSVECSYLLIYDLY